MNVVVLTLLLKKNVHKCQNNSDSCGNYVKSYDNPVKKLRAIT